MWWDGGIERDLIEGGHNIIPTTTPYESGRPCLIESGMRKYRRHSQKTGSE